MKYLLAVLLAAFVYESSAIFGFGKPWPMKELKAKYNAVPIDSFFDLPKSSSSKLQREYEQVDDASGLGVNATLWCRKGDPRVCLIQDLKGNTVGLQMSMLDQDTQSVKGYNYSKIDSYVPTNYYGQPAKSLRVFHFNPETLTKEGRPHTTQTAEGVWVKLNGVWENLPVADPNVDQSGNFYKQACFPQMGQHYFYKMHSSETDCSSQIAFFGIYHNGGLVGWGLANYGKGSSAKGGRNWYESVPMMGVRLIMPDRPPCVDELVKENGLFSMHVYFVDTPYLIGCSIF